MNAQQFLTWMRSVRTPSENPGPASRDVLAQLDALLDAFPYFQSGHLLYIKNLHNQGSFLYNNQLKTAAAYAVNRKVLYQLITQKETGDGRREAGEVKHTTVEQPTIIESKEEQISQAPKFPPKKFTSNPDEWEAGMLRQLQLLHHWKKTQDEKQENVPGSQFPVPGSEKTPGKTEDVDLSIESKEIPAAKDEINTLLYVLVEPGQSEDLPEEATEGIAEEIISDETEPTQWEIKTPEEKTEPAIEIPSDPVQQEILVEAIHSSFELEVDDKLPTAEELQPFKLEPSAESPAEKKEETLPVAEENVVTSFENMSFSEWIREVNRKVPAELPKTVLSEDKLIEQFIKEEPRIQVKKSGFYNPVNMAKKSVQDSDEFVTETLARIYAKQGNISKAIRAYQKLSLKFPEKTAYFAALIEELKRTPNK